MLASTNLRLRDAPDVSHNQRMLHVYKCASTYFLRIALALTLYVSIATMLASCAGKRLEERRFDLKGKVIAVDRTKGIVTIDHEDIVGYMPAMQMPFPIHDPNALKEIDSGDRVQATLVVTDESYWIENPFITKGLANASATPPAGALSEPELGAVIPDVNLINQNSKPIRIAQFNGRSLFITFIYTRCPLPDQCPLMSANFAQINAEIEKDSELKKRVHLLSVTLDPEYDTPAVLKSYGAAFAGAKFDNWDFATGDPEQIKRLAQSLGLMYKAENGQVVHSLRTALITPDGKLHKIYRGNEWKPAEVIQDVRALPTKSGAGN